MRKSTAATLSLIAACAASAAQAYDPIVTARGWVRVASSTDRECYGEVGTNGQFYVLAVYGMEPGEDATLVIRNDDMRPIVRDVRANQGGAWQDYYIPYRENREGGPVRVTLTSTSCQIPLDFSWQRKKGWDEPAPLRNPYAG
ncbi:MAG: hypothetical protein IE933_00360 [Sphingomonadales bacterium]|nr:hypothetical protein [Sphingomonadales bacterium]MBD3772777.1 hypothetical protein [Paracoccaceae bacterium]